MPFLATPQESDERFARSFIALSIQHRLKGNFEDTRRLEQMVVKVVGEAKAREIVREQEQQFA